MAKKNKSVELSSQFAAWGEVKNESDPNDKADYAVQSPLETEEEILNGRVEFFKSLDKECGKKRKVFVSDMSGEGEPIGQAFRITIPAKILGKNVSCEHYSISFRRSLDGKLLVTEWFNMPGNSNCQ